MHRRSQTVALSRSLQQQQRLLPLTHEVLPPR
jgi:hypothetical protein